MPSFRFPKLGRAPIALSVTLGVAAAGASWLFRGAPLHAEDATLREHAGHSMDDRAMERWVRDWYAAHPASPTAVAVAGAPADTFLAVGLRFDADDDPATVVDQARIFAGQSILWQWVDGIHTTTNGTGAADPGAGLLWDAPLTSTSPQFVRRFDDAGSFPFFCRPHEGFNMKGSVIVSVPADTFVATGTAFDTDANPATQVDTAFVSAGQAVIWRNLSGIHTVTSGTGSADPGAGATFDVPLTASAPVFTFVFDAPGTYPFFCRPRNSTCAGS